MFESKHCYNCFFATKSKVSDSDCQRWCALKHSEHSICDSCSKYHDIPKEDK